MIKKNRIVVVMPAYNAETTLVKTRESLPSYVDTVILCDDGSHDNTARVSREHGISTIVHARNGGYGRNQKTLYDAVKKLDGVEIVVMVHPDNQYQVDNLDEMINLITDHGADLVLGTRMKTALKNGMPMWKYVSNRGLSFMQNRVFGSKLSEFHSGLRVYKAETLLNMPYHAFSNDFVFDSQVIAWLMKEGYSVQEADAICNYTDEVSSINFRRSLKYGLDTLGVLVQYRFGKPVKPVDAIEWPLVTVEK